MHLVQWTVIHESLYNNTFVILLIATQLFILFITDYFVTVVIVFAKRISTKDSNILITKLLISIRVNLLYFSCLKLQVSNAFSMWLKEWILCILHSHQSCECD